MSEIQSHTAHTKGQLCTAVRELLESLGVRSARVSVELLPDTSMASFNRTTTTSNITVTVSGDDYLPSLDQGQLSSLFAPSLASEGFRDVKANQKVSSATAMSSVTTIHSSPGSRHSSVVLVEEQKPPEPLVRCTPAAATPLFSILNTDSGEVGDRHAASPHGPGAVHVFDLAEAEEQRYQPILGEAQMEASPQSILISSITGALRQNSASHSLPMGKADAVKLPSLAEKSEGIAGDGNGMVGKAAGEQIAGNRPISQSKSACNNGNGHNMEIKHSTRGARNTAPCIADGKRRLQELLQEQQMMEEKDLEGRLRHEGYIKEAEKYLNELRQMRRGNGPSNGGMLAPRVTLTTGPRPPSGVRKANSPSGPCTGISDIKVVKFTLPSSEKAKDEVVAQLKASAEGARHLANKDKFALLLREQQILLHNNASTEEEYQKLVRQAIECQNRSLFSQGNDK